MGMAETETVNTPDAMSLDAARAEIRAVDEEMRTLFVRRMEAVRNVAAYKRDRGLAIEDLAQEERVVAALAPGVKDQDMRSFYVRFLHDVMDNSKRWQHYLNNGVRVAFSGVEGAFAHIAATRIFPNATPVPYGSFEEAYHAVEQGECDLTLDEDDGEEGAR